MKWLTNWRRTAGWILAVAILIFLAQSILASWDKVAASGFRLQFDVPLLVISLGLLILGRALGVEAWRRILLALGNHISFRFAFYAWFVSNLARYVPGNIWQVATMMVLVEREGVSKANALLSQAVYTAIALSVTALFGLTLLPIAQEYLPFAALLFVGLIVFFALPPVFRLMLTLTSRVTRALRKNGIAAERKMPDLTFVRGLVPPLCSTLMWAVNGAAFYFFVRSITDVPTGGLVPTPMNSPQMEPGMFHLRTWGLADLPAFAAINAASYFIGYVSFITPSGLGFREGAMALLLAAFFPAPVAVGLAFLTRLWSTAGEMLAVLIAFWGAPGRSPLTPSNVAPAALPPAEKERGDSSPVAQ